MNIPSRRAGILALALATTLLATACDNGTGLLQSIQGEAKASKDSVFLKAAVRDLVSYDGKYYAQLVGIYERPAPGTVATGWTLTKAFGSLGSDYGCRGLVATASGLYAAIYSRDGGTETPVGIYVNNLGTWTHPYAGTENIQALYGANDEVFAVTMTVTNDVPHYALKYFDGSGLQDITNLLDVASFPAGVIYSGGNYYSASGTNLYQGTTGSMTPIAAGKTITRMIDNGGDFYLGTKDGYVLHYSGTTLTTTKFASSDTDYGITALALVPASAGTYLLAGNSYEGYYESPMTGAVPGSFSLGSSSKAVAGSSNYDTSLKYLPIYAFSYVGTAGSGTLFAAGSSTMSTSYPGLWSNAWDGSTWSGWTAE